jgi:hypothetical protein
MPVCARVGVLAALFAGGLAYAGLKRGCDFVFGPTEPDYGRLRHNTAVTAISAAAQSSASRPSERAEPFLRRIPASRGAGVHLLAIRPSNTVCQRSARRPFDVRASRQRQACKQQDSQFDHGRGADLSAVGSSSAGGRYSARRPDLAALWSPLGLHRAGFL